jgi:hypothetical protein
MVYYCKKRTYTSLVMVILIVSFSMPNVLPLLDTVHIDNYIVPVLHILIGVGNALVKIVTYRARNSICMEQLLLKNEYRCIKRSRTVYIISKHRNVISF